MENDKKKQLPLIKRKESMNISLLVDILLSFKKSYFLGFILLIKLPIKEVSMIRQKG